jgi:hypothetical protein
MWRQSVLRGSRMRCQTGAGFDLRPSLPVPVFPEAFDSTEPELLSTIGHGCMCLLRTQ